MNRRRLAATLVALMFASAARAQTELCQAVAHRLWTQVAVAPLLEQDPLAELSAVEPRSFRPGQKTLAKPGQSIADSLIQDHAADAPLAEKLRALPPTEAARFGGSDAWLLDRVDGTLGCHTVLVVAVPRRAPRMRSTCRPARARPPCARCQRWRR
jgi:hypothetical protein